MENKHSLKQRIVTVFAVMSALIAGVFAAGVVVTVHVVEKRLSIITLGSELHRLLMMEDADDWQHRPYKRSLFYVQGGAGDLAMTPSLEALDEGFHELTRENRPYYAMVESVSGRKYVLLRDLHSSIKRERILLVVVFISFVLSVLLAILLGRLLAHRVIAPVIRLSRQVRQREQFMGQAPALAPEYAKDEVGTLAVAFDKTMGQLRAALGREKLFTSDVSHELRTPLMILISSSELLLENPSLDKRSHSQVVRIARASAAMQQLVETFLLLARAESNQPNQGPRSTLSMVANELVELWGEPIRQKGLELIHEPQEPSDTLYNATLLHSVMGNLLRNAWHYTDQGFIRLTLKADSFVVEDSGIGIPAEKQQEMFQPFIRGDEQRGDGLGLGLSLVQRICANQQWQVLLTSREPNGCRFEVRLEGGG
ncbi:two-component sensor histidine kinase [Pseudomonas cichorii]|uniref:sensor histidine kinase n=1 Tax=Pseudomonas cichorii TaxID=36746 RepID=UPI0019102637|nr:HAMP domain-containing sensor histidine kinase [Pseudomonas cichorii]GFM84967.1 two-component sensor histidine kinase [Pseudomonas cichorii]